MIPESNILPEFNQYFRLLTPTNSDNPWLPEFLKNICDESTSGGTNCDYDSRLLESVDNDVSSHETLVMDSVFAFAHALDGIYRDLCPDTSDGEICPEIRSFKGEELLRELVSTSFTSLANGDVSFMPNGDVFGQYSIRYLKQLDDGGYKFVTVGQWNETTDINRDINTVIQERNIPWYLLRGGDQVEGIPRSVCSESCDVGERINIDADYPCCWTCSPCHNDEIVVNNNTECWSCIDKDNMIFAWPNENSTVCLPLVPDRNSWTIGITLTSVLGLTVAVMTIVLYRYNHENALIKASGRELSYLILIGELLF